MSLQVKKKKKKFGLMHTSMYSNIGCALSWSEPDAETSITLKLRVCKLKSRHFK